MGDVAGILKVHVIKGTNLAVRDLWSSDPYVILRLGSQKVKTRVIKKNLNPIWNEDLSLLIPNSNTLSLKLEVFDRDLTSRDDKMGDAEINLEGLARAVRMRKNLRTNGFCDPNSGSLSSLLGKEELCIKLVDGYMMQEVCVALQNVECGNIELQLKWIDLSN